MEALRESNKPSKLGMFTGFPLISFSNPLLNRSAVWNINDDFSSSAGWTASGSAQSYDATNDEWDFTSPNTSGAMYVYADPMGAGGVTGDFYMDMKIRFDTLDSGDGCGVGIHFIGLSDISTTQGINVSQDALGFSFWNNDVVICNVNNAGTPQPTTGDLLTTGTKYLRMYRSGSTFYVDFDDNSDFSSPIYSANGTVAGSGFRYIHLYSHHTNSGACGAGSCAYSIDDFRFVNGQSTPVT